MRNLIYLLLLFTTLFISCNKEYEYKSQNIQAVKLLSITDIGRNTCVIKSIVNTNNGYLILERGVCYSLDENPTIYSHILKANNTNSGIGEFQSDLSKLIPGKRYYVRAYSTNTQATAYSQEIRTFKTLEAVVPTITTKAVSNITATSALTGGDVTDEGGYSVTERGICYSNTKSTPTIDDLFIKSGTGLGKFDVNMTNLPNNRQYYIRAYAKTSFGVGYGQAIAFNTLSITAPTGVTTLSPTNITHNSAYLNGSVSGDGGSSIIERGFAYSTIVTSPTVNDSKVTSGTGTGAFSSILGTLNPGATYYYRAYARNNIGITYGSALSLRTSTTAPLGVTTISSNNITSNSALLTGSFSSNGGSTILVQGFVYSTTNSNPTTSSSVVYTSNNLMNFSSTLTNLSSNTRYYFRAFVTNASGTSYGTTVTFTTSVPISAPSSITTYSVSNISSNSAIFSGYVGSAGNGTITERGFVISSNYSTPTINNSTIVNTGSTGVGSFAATYSSLSGNTTYYMRAYAVNSAGLAYGNTVTFTTSVALKVGDSYLGGKIAYILKSGENGFVSGQIKGYIIPSSFNYSTYIWGCYGSTISTSTSLGAGNTNTNSIYNYCGSSTAAGYAYNLITGGYSDWYLPSYSELSKVMENASTLSIPSYDYWTSSQSSTTSAYTLNRNQNLYNISKNSYRYVLPIRSF